METLTVGDSGALLQGLDTHLPPALQVALMWMCELSAFQKDTNRLNLLGDIVLLSKQSAVDSCVFARVHVWVRQKDGVKEHI